MIGGQTKTVFVVADPVFQLRTPAALNDEWAARELDLITVPAQVSARELGAFLWGMRANRSAAGAVVSIPHKQAIVDLCDELGPHARLSGAVNAVRRTAEGRLVGETFDGLGFVRGLVSEGLDPRGKRALVLGAGGAASAVSAALIGAGVQSLSIGNRTPDRAVALAERLRDALDFDQVAAGFPAPEQIDLVVNATSIGMNPADALHYDPAGLPSTAIVADVVVSAEHTPLLAAAEARGLRAHGGRHMLAGQIQLIADFLGSPDGP